jgi:hypothetical protein
MNGAAIAAACAFDLKRSASYQTPAHRVSQTVAKKESDKRRSKAGEAPKTTVDHSMIPKMETGSRPDQAQTNNLNRDPIESRLRLATRF